MFVAPPSFLIFFLNTLAPKASAISLVLSVLSSSTRMISFAKEQAARHEGSRFSSFFATITTERGNLLEILMHSIMLVRPILRIDLSLLRFVKNMEGSFDLLTACNEDLRIEGFPTH